MLSESQAYSLVYQGKAHFLVRIEIKTHCWSRGTEVPVHCKIVLDHVAEMLHIIEKSTIG